jgi:hypothetical protein
MKYYSLKCNNCQKELHSSDKFTAKKLPDGWLKLTWANAIEVMHFCSIACLDAFIQRSKKEDQS